MQIRKYNIILICLYFVFSTCQHSKAQLSLAQDAYTILEQNCSVCHGLEGSYKDNLLIEYNNLIETMAVIPNNPDESELYKRLIASKESNLLMPLGGDPLPPADIETIRQWILAGAPDWNDGENGNFISIEQMLDTIQQHLNSLDSFDRPYARYFTLTHLYNSGENNQTLYDYQIALSKLVNSLSWEVDIINPTPIDSDSTVYYIDLRHYKWQDDPDRWSQLESVYPYTINFNPETQTELLDKITNLRNDMNCKIPFIYVDWFLATASLPPLYNDILGLPQTDRDLEDVLDIDVAENIQTSPGISVWRAGFNDSGVSNHNRVVERHKSQYGAYWKSYDFAGSSGVQNIFQHPLSFKHDGGEIIFNLPNGLQAYFLVDAVGSRLDVAPTDIVSNPLADDPAVRNGLSCIGCHTEGMRKFEDEVRAVIENAENPIYDKAQALRLYPEQAVLNRLIEQDTQRFQQALISIGGPFENEQSKTQFLDNLENEPIQRFHTNFYRSLDVNYAASSVGLETKVFLDKIENNQDLKNIVGTLATGNQRIKRDTWTSVFPDVVDGLYPDPDPIPHPDDPDDPDDPIVYIPDLNLRAVIEEILDKPFGARITKEEMKRITRIDADNKEIIYLTGLEYAKNLERIEFRNNSISDLSPLTELTRLNNIKLRGNKITNVMPLANLTDVDWLGLEGNQITDLTPLSGLVKLEGIGISGNPIEDISPLANLTSLNRIDAWQTPISDFSSLESLPNLNWVEYGNDKRVTKLPTLKGLKSLTRLEIHGCSVSDLTSLSEFTQLEWLELINNNIRDLKPLSNLKNLTILNLDANLITDVTPLTELKKLEVLYLENNIITDISSLSGLTNLNRLDVRNNAIKDFSVLEAFSDNTFVRTSGNPAFPIGGPQITGPWLWAIVPGTRLDDRTDFLARATGGAATEIKVSTNGATAGKPVGDSVWTWSNISIGGNNINEMTESLGWGTGSEIYDHIVYGATILDSPTEQKTQMFVGSDDGVKVWLNGDLVHKAFITRGAGNYDAVFPVTLKQGKNALLVAIDNHGHGGFGGNFGFAVDAKYEVFKPNLRFFFETNTTSFEIGDSFILNLNTENAKKVAGWQADLIYNSEVLQVDEVNEGDLLKSEEITTRFHSGTIDNEIGKVKNINSIFISDTVNGKGTLCSIVFSVIGPGECLITFEDFEVGSSNGNPLPNVAPEYLVLVMGDDSTYLPTDINKDGEVDIRDIVMVAQSIGDDVADNPDADVNNDGSIDIIDLVMVAQSLGESVTSAPALLISNPYKLTPDIIKKWIYEAEAADDGSTVFKQGLHNLNLLLELVVVPEKTALLPAYPNPFNPETWIPYQLSESTQVVLTIYSAYGTKIRTLELGNQSAGLYKNRSRAAYWDGKNEIGEIVASGVYFYTISAGNFTATRKMYLMK